MFNIEENQMVWIDSTIVNLEDLLNKFDSEEMEQNHLIWTTKYLIKETLKNKYVNPEEGKWFSSSTILCLNRCHW